MALIKRLAAVAAALPVLLAVAPPVAAQPAAPGRERAQVTVALTEMTPRAEASGKRSVIRVRGRVQNGTTQAVEGIAVRLRYSGQAAGSRGQLDQLAAAEPGALPGRGADVPLPQAVAAGGAQDFELTLNARAAGFRSFGVYPVGVEVVNAAQQPVAGVTSFTVLTTGRRDFTPVRIGWVWPLIDRMHRTTDTTFIDDRLTGAMNPGGRLHGLVQAAAGTKTPITWAVDPALLDDARAMSQSAYTVQNPRGGKRERKPASKAARDWLAALKSASSGDPYFTVPYADPDVVALARYRMFGDIKAAYEHGGVAAQILGRQPAASYAWPPSGMAGPSTLNQLAQHSKVGPGGNGSFLLSDTMFAPPANGTPRATTRIETDQGARNVVAYDEKLSRLVSQDSKAPGAAVLNQQRFLAETAMITAEAPNTPRTLVVAPNRHWNPAPAYARTLLSYTAGAPWLKEEPLDKIAKVAPQERASTGYPDEYERYELDPAYLSEVRGIAKRATAFTGIMAEPFNMTYRPAVLRMQSAAWRGRPGRAKQARTAFSAGLDRDMGGVRVLDNKRSLAGRSGRIFVTIANELPDQRVRVRLDVTSQNTAKLQIGRIEEGTRVIDLEPGQKTTRNIPLQASGNGNFQIHLQLLSEEGRRFDDGHDITVRTTGYGQSALLITGGGLAVLFVGVGVRAMRARRRRNAEAAGDESTGGPRPGEPLGTAAPGTWTPESAGPWPADDWPADDPAARPAYDPAAEPAAPGLTDATGVDGAAEPAAGGAGTGRRDGDRPSAP